MSIRDIIILSIVFISIPFCFTRPWIGILVFSWLGYMNPHKYAWGIAQNYPLAQIVAIPTLAGFIFAKDKEKLPIVRETILIILLWILFTITSYFSFYPDYAWPLWQKTSKILLMCLVTTCLFMNRKKLRYLFLTIAFSLGLLGAKGGLWAVLTGGSWNVRGPDDSFISGEGDFGLALNMTLPLIFFLAKEEQDKRIKLSLQVIFAFTIIATIFTYRRGAFLTLAVVIFMLLIKSKRKMLAGAVLTVGVTMVSLASLIPQQWSERMGTMQTYEQDASAMGRINAWKSASNVAKDKPLIGAGFGGLTGYTIEIYSPHPEATAADVHSIYFEVLGEHGYIALILFLTLLASCFISLRKIRRDFKNIPSGGWLRNYSHMLEVSLIAYMVGGAFLGRAYFDLFYHLVCTVIVLKQLAKRELASTFKQAAEERKFAAVH